MQFQFTGKSPSRNLGSQFEKMCMNDLTDTQLLSKKTINSIYSPLRAPLPGML